LRSSSPYSSCSGGHGFFLITIFLKTLPRLPFLRLFASTQQGGFLSSGPLLVGVFLLEDSFGLLSSLLPRTRLVFWRSVDQSFWPVLPPPLYFCLCRRVDTPLWGPPFFLLFRTTLPHFCFCSVLFRFFPFTSECSDDTGSPSFSVPTLPGKSSGFLLSRPASNFFFWRRGRWVFPKF